MLQRRLRVVMYGLGKIGIDIAEVIHRQPHLELVGAIDQNPKLVGQDIGTLFDTSQPLGIKVGDSPDAVFPQARPDVVVIATSSFLSDVFGQIRCCLDVKAHVVSTCEELIYPKASHPAAAEALDNDARKAGVAVLGVGINPGFVMDFLPIVMTAASVDIRQVQVTRVVDASTRRATLQQRIGAGLDAGAFRDWLRQRSTPHVGLAESTQMIADAIGWPLDGIHQEATPILADQWLRTPYVTVAPGQVAGIRQIAEGSYRHHCVIRLDWRTAIGMPDTHDAIKIDGDPPVDLLIRGGLHGDRSTAALVTRSIGALPNLRPGLRTVLDLPILHYSASAPFVREQMARPGSGLGRSAR